MQNLDCLPEARTCVPTTFSDKALEIRKVTHRTIEDVTNSLETFRFNVGVAKLHELVNNLQDFTANDIGANWALREGLEAVVRLVAPMMPHLAEELWRRLGHDSLVTEEPWMEPERDLIIKDLVTVAIQINGKLRGTIEVRPDIDKQSLVELARAEENISNTIGEKTVKKLIVVPARVINFVV